MKVSIIKSEFMTKGSLTLGSKVSLLLAYMAICCIPPYLAAHVTFYAMRIAFGIIPSVVGSLVVLVLAGPLTTHILTDIINKKKNISL